MKKIKIISGLFLILIISILVLPNIVFATIPVDKPLSELKAYRLSNDSNSTIDIPEQTIGNPIDIEELPDSENGRELATEIDVSDSENSDLENVTINFIGNVLDNDKLENANLFVGDYNATDEDAKAVLNKLKVENITKIPSVRIDNENITLVDSIIGKTEKNDSIKLSVGDVIRDDAAEEAYLVDNVESTYKVTLASFNSGFYNLLSDFKDLEVIVLDIISSKVVSCNEYIIINGTQYSVKYKMINNMDISMPTEVGNFLYDKNGNPAGKYNPDTKKVVFNRGFEPGASSINDKVFSYSSGNKTYNLNPIFSKEIQIQDNSGNKIRELNGGTLNINTGVSSNVLNANNVSLHRIGENNYIRGNIINIDDILTTTYNNISSFSPFVMFSVSEDEYSEPKVKTIELEEETKIKEETKTKDETPKTGDNKMIYTTFLIISTLGLGIVLLKNRNNIKNSKH